MLNDLSKLKPGDEVKVSKSDHDQAHKEATEFMKKTKIKLWMKSNPDGSYRLWRPHDSYLTEAPSLKSKSK